MIDRVLGAAAPATLTPVVLSFDQIVADRILRLTDYQDAAYAQRYRALVDEVRAAESRVAGDDTPLSCVVARQFAKLMMVKDEYEVARLYSSPAFRAGLDAEFDGIRSLRFNLAPPLFARPDPTTGHLLKREYGAWMLGAMGWVARLRRLRGSAFDLFVRTEERRMERALIADYEHRIRALLPELDASRLALAIQIADVPEQIRGFGHVKERNVVSAQATWATLSAQWKAEAQPPKARAA
jgi:indolepyruvate ferredoxin oxidoreductase